MSHKNKHNNNEQKQQKQQKQQTTKTKATLKGLIAMQLPIVSQTNNVPKLIMSQNQS